MSAIKQWIDDSLKPLQKRSEALNKYTIAVGWVKPSRHPKTRKITKKSKKSKRLVLKEVKEPYLAQIARWLHIGNSHMPARPFFDVLLRKHSDAIRAIIAKELYDNKTPNVAESIKKIREVVKGQLQRTMLDSNEYAPNAESTIKRKKSSRPLIDTMTLIRSIDTEVRRF